MRALVVSPEPFFSPRGTPFSVYYRTLISAELGVDIDLLTYGQGQDVDIDGVRIIRIPNFARLGRVKVGPSGLKLFLDIILAFFMVVMLLRHRYDFVHAHEESVFIAWAMKPFFGFKLVYDMHSSLSQQLTNFNFTRSRFLVKLFEWLETSTLKSADVIITICPDLNQYVNGIISNRGKHFLIENSIFETVRFKNRQATTEPHATRKIELPVKLRGFTKILLYAGTLELYQGIDILLRAFAIASPEIPDTALLVAGGSPEQVQYYRFLAENLGVGKQVTFSGRVPQNVAKTYTQAANVLLSPRNGGTNTPLKIYEQLASGVPLVATSIYSHTQVLNNDVAFLVKPTPPAIAAGILNALDPQGPAEQKTAKAKCLYRDKYSREIYTKKMKQLLEYLR